MQRVHPDDLALVTEVIERATKEKREFDFEHRRLMPDGSVKRLHMVAHLMIDKRGALQFVGSGSRAFGGQLRRCLRDRHQAGPGRGRAGLQLVGTITA